MEGGVQQWERKLRDKTKKALKQVLKMRSEDDKREFETKAKLWAVSVHHNHNRAGPLDLTNRIKLSPRASQ